jgi:thioredoxin reductase (NADPH)
MARPIILVVHEDAPDRELLERELTDRYSNGYQIVCETSPLSALERLKALRAMGDAPVFIMFSSQRMGAMSGTEFFERAHRLYPHAQRVLLVPWSNRSASKPLLRMISQGRFDRYTTVPTRPADEDFHYLVTELLRELQQQHHGRPSVVTLIDRQWSPRSYQLRDLLQRGGLPFTFHRG